MERKALIITNPGEPGAENYCHGVNKDRENYRAFLDSEIGGWWYPSEIRLMDRPRIADVMIAVRQLRDVDYSLVVFSGHACHSTTRGETILELREGQDLEASYLRVEDRKQTLILDCCRVYTGEDLRESLVLKAERALPAPVDGPRCRAAFEHTMQRCPVGITIMHACAEGERAYDGVQGGAYSYSLIRSAREWAESTTCDTRSEWDTLSVAGAHERAVAHVAQRRGQRQTPCIEKPRSGPYFPFAVIG